MIVGTQDIPGNGGLLITDKKYKDFEIILEMKNDFGPDSGLFMRSTEKGQAYQAMIDYYPKGTLMGLYGAGLRPARQTHFNTHILKELGLQGVKVLRTGRKDSLWSPRRAISWNDC